MKKTLLLALAFIGLSAGANAQNGTCGANTTWRISNDSLYIEGTGAMDFYNIHPAPWASYKNDFHIVVVGNGVTSIAEYAFGYWTSYDNLNSVTIGESVTNIGKQAFYSAMNLATVYFNAVNCQTIGEVNASGGLTPAFLGAGSNLPSASVIIGENVQRIPDNAFAGFNKLSSVNLPNSLTYIGEKAFWSCERITSVTIPNSITSISDQCFLACTALTSITIPNSVTEIGAFAFANTGWYNAQPNGVLYLGDWLIGYKGTPPANTNISILYSFEK